MNETESISLLQLLNRLKTIVSGSRELSDVWVVGQISDMRSSGGHAYFEFVEKDLNGIVVAKMRSTIWRGTISSIFARHGADVRSLFANDVEVRLKGSLQFHQQFGLTFNVTDIDPLYRKNQQQLQLQILAALRSEGIIDLNKNQALPLPPQRIAVISAKGAAGYGDFMNQLEHNPYGFVFYTKLFEATMQGASTSASIRAALEQIDQYPDLFECVVIIRGGGATTDLAGFDDLQLARQVALFPIPIVVGIGHERDNTVLDFIAHTRVKTPTAAAEWLIALASDALAKAQEAATAVANYVQGVLTGELRQLAFLEERIPLLATTAIKEKRSRLNEVKAALPLALKNRLLAANSSLDAASSAVQSAGRRRVAVDLQRLGNYSSMLQRNIQVAMANNKMRLNQLQQMIEVLDPKNILRRGYSVTRLNGKAIRNASDAPKGAKLTTTLLSGTIESTVD